MFKKIVLTILCILLVSCSNDSQDVNKPQEKEESIFIDPIKDVFLFDELNNSIRNRWLEIINIDGNRGVNNYQIEMLYKDIYDKQLLDINGNIVDLSADKIVFNFVSTDCGVCKAEISQNITDLVSEYKDVTFIQYFGVGHKVDILNLYDNLNIEIPDNLIIIEENDDFKNYMKYDLKAEMYPTFVFFNKGKVTLDLISTLSLKAYKLAYDLAFKKPIKYEDLINDEGISIFELNRTSEDLRNDLSEDNKARIDYLDDKTYLYTSETTYKLMGKKLDFSNLLDGNTNTISEIDDYSYYKDKDLVIFYEAFKSEEDIDKIEYINSLMVDDSKEYIVVLLEGFESQTYLYENMDVKFNCPVVSNLGYMPKAFYSVAIAGYPTAIFVKDSYFTGAYGPIKQEYFEYALDTFLGDNCIALKENN